MFNNIGVSGLVIILVIALIVFGPAKLPLLGRAFGDTLREFRSSTRGIVDDDQATSASERKDDVQKLL
ncbi:twin-arginine translocase TatA/TatE family subunit [Paenibacillus harenae]|uniref:Sec-independent protein translocase protein TatA n=1 Tax=Paenibacillus harenae TaxID=306543 RepID=A0ABT9U598_PAEHA|nr:twin-arginine translocase TatA/TatE family subunit [Paenibacillus harenae]MDQ0114810.1 sec-independent protein translocase protein TatA [Paenibacillus harenae]